MKPRANAKHADALLALLGTGAAAARTSRDLADALGVAGDWRRRITEAVAALRKRGIPVCASKSEKPLGYFLPANWRERDSSDARRAGEAKGMLRKPQDKREQLPLGFGEAA